MGNRLAKPPPPGASVGGARGRNSGIPRPFPPITPQSYLPGSGGAGFPGVYPGTGGNPFPPLSPNSFLPPGGGMEPPIMNISTGPGILPAPASFPSMAPSMMPPSGFPPPFPYPNQPPIPMLPPPPPMYEPDYPSYSRRRPTRICRPRRSRRCRPVIHIIDSDSCSSVSSYRSLSPCHRRRRRSRSCSRRRAITPQQQQQPIIVLPVQCQQPSSGLAAPSVTNAQPQQIILPPIQVQQSGQYPSQQLALPPISLQALGGQQQQLALPPIPLNSSNLIASPSTSPMIITSAGAGAGGLSSLIQTSPSLPQVTSIAQGQPIQAGRIQYVQAMPQSSSPLQYVQSGRSTVAPSRVLVNSTNKKSTTTTKKPLERSLSARQVPQMDLKYGRRPFDWYKNKGNDNVINENVQIGQR